MTEAPFQTNTHLSLKKRIKKEKHNTEQKNPTKKTKKTKTLQTTRAYQL